jgi:putative component of membrane protein insertase Oxa1/YidC/SpoIIIJ protein YidD
MRFNTLLLMLYITALQASPSPAPWGKDAHLVSVAPNPLKTSCTNAPTALSQLFIRFHQEVISPADGPRSHFYPSSSQYTYEALSHYGFFKGWALGCDRLMRENDEPWIYSSITNPEGFTLKYDPVLIQ